MKTTINTVTIETATNANGKPYKIALVNYGDSNYEKKIVDWANPVVFKDIQSMEGKQVDITETKKGKYTEWAKVELVSSESPPHEDTELVTKVVGNKYLTKEERAQQQVYIVRQSCLKAAVDSLSPAADTALDESLVLERAQLYVDWVLRS